MPDETDQAERAELIAALLKLKRFAPSHLRSRSALKKLPTNELREILTAANQELDNYLISFVAKGLNTDSQPFLDRYGIAAGFIGLLTVAAIALALWQA